MDFYLRVEGVNLDSVLLDTNQLSVIRGSGLCLRELPLELEKRLPDVTSHADVFSAITTAASIGLYSFQAKTEAAAELVTADIRKWLAEQLPEYTFVVDFTVATGNFNQCETRLVNLNRVRQLKQLSLAVPEISGYSEQSQFACSYDGIRPLQKNCIRVGRPVSSSVAARFDHGRKARQTLVQSLTNNPAFNELAFTDDLQSLAASDSQGTLDQKLAAIYFDGNKFGTIKEQVCRSPATMKSFDDTVQGHFNQFLESLVSYMQANEDCVTPDGKVRLEILLWGGDEIMIVVPAWIGLHAVDLFYSTVQHAKIPEDEVAFEAKSNVKNKKKQELQHSHSQALTFSGGIVFTQATTPIREISALVREVADTVSAKHKNENAFDYLILESTDYPTTSLSDYRKLQYGAYSEQRTFISEIRFDQVEVIRELASNGALHRSQVVNLAASAIRGNPGEHEFLEKRLRTLLRQRTKMLDSEEFDFNDLLVLAGKSTDNLVMRVLFRDSGDSDPKSMWPFIHLAELWDYLFTTSKPVEL